MNRKRKAFRLDKECIDIINKNVNEREIFDSNREFVETAIKEFDNIIRSKLKIYIKFKKK